MAVAKLGFTEQAYGQPFWYIHTDGLRLRHNTGGNPKRTVSLVRKEGVASDLINEIELNHYKIVLIGKKSFNKKTSYLLGNRANKILYNVRGVILCLLDFL
jgi:hypothetical protein